MGELTPFSEHPFSIACLLPVIKTRDEVKEQANSECGRF